MPQAPVARGIPRIQRAHALLLRTQPDIHVAAAQNLPISLRPVGVVVLLRADVEPLDKHGAVEPGGIHRTTYDNARLVRRRAGVDARSGNGRVAAAGGDARGEVLPLAVTPRAKV